MGLKYQNPTFRQRIRLLTIGAEEVRRIASEQFETDAHSTIGYTLDEAAALVFAEVERMENANRRFEAQRKAKTAPKETAITN